MSENETNTLDIADSGTDDIQQQHIKSISTSTNVESRNEIGEDEEALLLQQNEVSGVHDNKKEQNES